MADGAVNFLLDKLTTVLVQEASILGDAQDIFENIKLELRTMRSFLQDAEKKRANSESVGEWVMQVREVAYEAEDVIDEFIHHKDLGRHGRGYRGFYQDIVNLPTHVTSRRLLHSKLKKIQAKVHEVSERSKRYSFHPTDDERSRNAACRDHGGYSVGDEEDDIVGMKENIEKLTKWLNEGEPRQTIISVVGMGGVGKTTLVSQIYKDQPMKRHFDCWAWISVSQAYGFGELLRSMIKELMGTKLVRVPSNLGSMNETELLRMLIDYLHEKRYVVVLDDVWWIEDWIQIRTALPKNNNGSRVILTTRNENIASALGIGSRIYRLDPLGDNDAWTLFRKKAFWKQPEHSCPRELQALAQAIVKKCEGLPLAIVTIGGLMSSRNRTALEWKHVYDSLNWQLSNHPSLEKVKYILSLSFENLPFYLKHCFLFCCTFRDGYPIKRKKLIRLWVAEGFIEDRKGMTMEEVAEEYLGDLIFRNMIQVTGTNDAGRVKTCQVHDVVRELAITMSKKENFCAASDGEEARLEGKIRHLSFYNRGNNISLSKSMSRHLRSFFVFQIDTCSSFSLDPFSSKFKFLRALELEGVPIKTVPSSMVDLFTLRYLNLRETMVEELPKSMDRLTNLETLDVRNTNIKELPSEISKLQHLRHLYMYCHKNHNSETSNLLSGMQAPKKIWKIRSLQTLACIQAEDELIKQIKNLTELRRLEVMKLKAVDGPTFCASIKMMPNLLRLGVTSVTEEEELRLEVLSQPPPFLQKLTLVGRLNNLPHWIGSMENLTHLYLESSLIYDNILSSLHGLSTLVFLELKKAYNGTFLHFQENWFTRLRKLILVELQKLSIVRVEENALPSIRELHLVRCPHLTAVPEGIQHLTGLQKLHLEEMPQEFVHRLQTDASEDLKMVQHIPTINYVYLTGQTRVVETL